MSTPKFVEIHNLVSFLEKPKESNRFEDIIDFLNASSIKYALTVNPTVYESCIQQFWATAMAKTVNGKCQIQALVDKKKVIISEKSVRRDLMLEDAEGIESWNEFSSTMASALICLATNQKFNFSKYIFDHMMKNLEGWVKFLMYPRFVQVFLDKQVEGMSKHKGIYVTPSHTKKIFANINREGKRFSGKVIPLFQTMMVQAPEDIGEDSAALTDSYSTPIITQPSSSKPQKKYLQEKVLDLEKAKTAQVKEIASLKKREDASKQYRKIVYLDADAEVTLIDETQERNDEEMKKHMEIVQDDEVAINAIPLATKPPMIVEYKIDKEGKMGYFKL
ncbi:hypothetical protein Tco_0625241, partial [Tanacetum coccineum]